MIHTSIATCKHICTRCASPRLRAATFDPTVSTPDPRCAARLCDFLLLPALPLGHWFVQR
jgi:hypothetical protein